MSETKHPDPWRHQVVSFAKSGLRILACVFLFATMFKSAAAVLAASEALGILEELV